MDELSSISFAGIAGGGPEWPVWGQVLFAIAWLALVVLGIRHKVKRRREHDR
jgi:hypothetical protein